MELLPTNKLKELRMKLGLRQEDVAKILHINLSDRVSRWENGKAMPSVQNLFKLCYLYQKTPQEIYEVLYSQIAKEIEARTQNSLTNQNL